MNGTIKLSRVTHIYIILLLLLNIFSLSTVESLRSIGRLSIQTSLISFVIIFAVYLMRGYYSSKLMFVYITVFLFIKVQIISFIVNNDSGYLLLFNVIATFIFIILSVQVKWDRYLFIGLGYVISLLIILLFIDWNTAQYTTHRFQSIFRNPNALAIFIFCSLYYQIMAAYAVKKIALKIYFLLILSVSIVLLLFTNSRSVLIAIGIIIIVTIVQMYKPRILKYLFLAAMFFNASFLFIYVKLYNTAIGDFINNISLALFDKNFFSGREDIWYNVWQHIEQSFLIGFGISANARSLNESGYTTHNQYLQTFLETGILGFIVFVFFLFAIWRLLLNSQNSLEGRLSTSFFIGILIYSSFELTLFQNNFQIGLLQWAIIATGIDLRNKRNN
ncbi:O-antigen ligase family protein [Amphibacillus cookii]|uniref:O-antigen ligase family protein n=1 Tax=Amphibacillus cookii TaxID=767787 RepID=UPI00195AFEDC|nr:O-antigen ligase family protein [Amphibacillus cookii]MBM7543082.1 O-antigen ligase [Amphibacillus cookii]